MKQDDNSGFEEFTNLKVVELLKFMKMKWLAG